MRPWRVVYWLLTGTLFGVGVAGMLSIGILLLPAGLLLLIVGLVVLRGRELWALPIGIGLLPALLISLTILTASPQCGPGGLTLPPGQTYAQCSGPIPELYCQLIAGFASVAVLGVVGFVAARRRGATRPPV